MDSVSSAAEPISIGDVLPDVTGSSPMAPVTIDPNAGKQEVPTAPLESTQAILGAVDQVPQTDVAGQRNEMVGLMQKLVNPPQAQADGDAALVNDDPATLSEAQALMQRLVSQDPVATKTPKEPHPVSYEQSAQEARESVTGKVQPSWRSGWNVPHREKIQYLAPANPFNRNITDLKEPVLAGLYDLRQLAQRNGYEVVIESGKDGKHATNSFHYAGEAIDVNFKKDGKNATYDKKALELFKTWSHQAGFATLYDEAHSYDDKGNMGAEKPGAHFHLAWSEDAKGMPGAYQLGAGRKKGSTSAPVPHEGQPKQTFADVQPLIEAHDYKTMPGKAAHAADVEKVDPRIFARLVQAESGFDHSQVSPVGAAGAAQLMPETAAWLAKKYNIPLESVKNDPYTNMKVGARYLGELTDQFGGNYVKGLAAYNMGPGALQSYLNGGSKLPTETRNYVYKIMKDLYPDQFKTPQSVDYVLQNGVGPTRSKQSYSQIKQEELRAIATPGQRIINGLMDMVPYGMRPGDGLIAEDVPQVKKDARNKSISSRLTPDVIEDMAGAQSGLIAELHNAAATFLSAAVPFGLVPNWRAEDIHEHDKIMSHFEEQGGFMTGLHKIGTSGLPWLAGTVVGFNKLLKGAGVMAGAAKNLPVIGKYAAPAFALASEAELSKAPLAVRYIHHLTTAGFKDSSKFFSATAALGSVLGLDAAGRHMMDWVYNEPGQLAKHGQRDLVSVAKDATAEGLWHGFLGGLASLALPMGLQMGASTLLRSPAAADALGKALTDANPLKAGLKRGVAGSIGGLVTSQGIVNPIAQGAGWDFDLSPMEGMSIGALLGAGGAPMLNKVSGKLGELGLTTAHPAFAAFKTGFDKMWDGLDDAYKNTFTKSAIDATKAVAERQAITSKIAKVRQYEAKMTQIGEEMSPTVNGMVSHLEQKQAEAQSLQAQSQQAQEAAKQAFDSLPPEKQMMVETYQKQQQQLESVIQKRDAVGQQAAAAQASKDEASFKSLNRMYGPLDKEVNNLSKAQAQLLKEHPEVPRILHLGKKAQQVGDTVSKQLPELQNYIQTVGVGVEKYKTFQQNILAEAERIRGVSDDVVADPGFNIGTDTELVKVQHLPGEFPDLPGLDRDAQARVATEVSRNAIRQLVDRYNDNGVGLPFFDHELLVLARKNLRDSLAGYQGPTGHDMSLFNNILEMEGKAKQKTSFLKKELFGEAPVSVTKQTTLRKMIKENSALRYEVKNKEAYGYVNAEVILDAAKKNGFDLKDATLQKRKSDLVNKGTGVGKDDYIVPASMNPSGETFTVKGVSKTQSTFQKFEMDNPELVSQALAAQAIGDTHFPVKLDSKYLSDFDSFTKLHAEGMIKDVRDNYTSTVDSTRKYLQEAHSQDVVKALPGFARDDGMGGAAVLNETWYEKSLDKRLAKKFFEKINGMKPTDKDIVEPIRVYMDELKNTPEGQKLINDMVSEEIRNVASIGTDLAGLGVQPKPNTAAGEMVPNMRVKKGDVLPEQHEKYRFASNDKGDFVVDSKGQVQFRQRKYYSGGVARQRAAMGIPDDMTHPSFANVVDELNGNDPMAFLNNEAIHLERLKRSTKEYVDGSKKLDGKDILGSTQEQFGEDTYYFRLSASEVASDIEGGLNIRNKELHSSLKLDSNPTEAQFMQDTIDALENGGEWASYKEKYGDIGKQTISNHLTVLKALDDFNKSCEFNKKFAAQSNFIHNFPEMVAHIRASTTSSTGEGISLSSALDRQRKLFPTMKKAREVVAQTEKELEALGITPDRYRKMTPEQRAQVTNPEIDWSAQTKARQVELIAEANQKATTLLARADIDAQTPGKLIGNRIKAMAHAEATRRFISRLMDTPTLDKAGNTRYLIRVREGNDLSVVTYSTPKGDVAEQQMKAGNLFSGSIDLKGKNVKLEDVYAHPEVMRFINDYATSVENGTLATAWKSFNRHTSAIRLLGSWIPFMSSTTTSLMADVTGNLLSIFSPSSYNLSGAGKKIREGGRGRLMELFAYRNGLNAAHIAENTVAISNNIVESMDEDVRNKTFGVGDNETMRLLAAGDPNNPARAEAYKQINPIYKRAADIFSVPLEVEKATMRHILYSHIRDAQLAAHYVRTNQLMVMEGGPLSSVSDPIKRLGLASQAASTMSNSNVGSMPYYLFDKQLRDLGQKTFLTPGWGLSVAHTIIDGMSGVLGLGSSRLRNISPGTVEFLEAAGRKLVGDKPLYAHVNPETREYIRNRMAKNIAGLVIASTAATETFNLMVNGQTSYSDPDSSRWGKIHIGNTTFSNPMFGYVKKMVKFFNAGVASMTKDDADSFFSVFADEMQNMLSPAFEEGAGLVTARMGSRKAMAEEAAVADDNIAKSGVKRVARAAMNTVGGQEILGFRPDADPTDVLALGGMPNLGLKNDSSDAARLGGSQYAGRVLAGVYDTTPNIARNLRGDIEAREGASRMQLMKQVENYFKAAMRTEDSAKQQELLEKAKTLAIQGIPVTDKVLRKVKERETMSQPAWQSLFNRYMNPMKGAMQGADSTDRILLRQKLEEYQGTEIDPYQSLIPSQPLDNEDEE